MRNKRILLSSISLVILLSSCAPKALREDIKEFVKTFSLNESIKAYKVAGYNEENIVITNGVINKTLTTLNFDTSDVNSPKYHKNTKTYIGEELEREKDEYIEQVEDKFYFHQNDEATEYDLLECHNLIQSFFYEQVEAEGTYHIRGHYYGDYILQSCSAFQNFITIDSEKELYIFEASQIKAAPNGEKVNVHQKYEVNKLGMLVTNNVEMISPSTSSYITIEVFNNTPVL